MLWDLIEVPFKNPKGITGPLTVAKFNPVNNILRFVCFISIPSLFFFVLCKSFTKKEETKKLIPPADKFNRFVPLLVLSFILYNLTISFINGFEDYAPFDSFHEGESLTAAYNYVSGLGLWKGTHFIHGAFYDPLKAVFGWKLFGDQTIGSFRVVNYALSNCLLPLSYYVFLVSKYYMTKNTILKIIPLTLMVLSLKEGFFNYFNQRDILVFVVLSLIIYERIKKNNFTSFIIGLLVCTNYFYTIDRGIYLLCAIIIYYVVCLITAEYKEYSIRKVQFFLIGLVIGLVLYTLIFGMDEMKYFFTTTYGFYTEKDYFDSYIFSKPSMNILKSYSSFSVYLLVLTILIFIYSFLAFYSKSTKDNIFFVHLVLVILSVFYFRSALGRSDFAHINYSIGFLVISFFYILIPIIFHFGNKFLKFSKNIQLILLSIFGFKILTIPLDTDKILSFSERLKNYTSLQDAHFLHGYMTLDTLEDLRDLVKNEDTVFNYTSEAAMPYLLRVKHCGRYYVPWFASSTARQYEIIDDIKKHKPKYVLYKSNHFANQMDNIVNSQRYNILDPYIKDNFFPYKSFQDNWWFFSSENLNNFKLSMSEKVILYSDGLYPFICHEVYEDKNILFHHSGYSFKIDSNIFLDHFETNKFIFKYGFKKESKDRFQSTRFSITEYDETDESLPLFDSVIASNNEDLSNKASIVINKNKSLEFKINPLEGSNSAWGWSYWHFPSQNSN